MALVAYSQTRGLCNCGNLVRSKGRSITGKQIFDKKCWKCRWGGYRVHKKLECELCSFVALHPVQLDVDHIDGNRHNNDIDNLQTLCANCHRLKTHINEDHLRR
jgi:5-methylcytosine-specific restriction endonuclease McrA